ncbi:MAG TPA: amidohydrolase family protein [Xanthobacteraceae bacterium]|nr:amidohydrolase family protein [Xanthobacteraceae bacterium]
MQDDIPIVDCHQHFWDLDRNYYPWLCDPVPVHFRYGDYSVIKRNYLPPDYLRDAGANRVVKTVHEEAWWNPADPVGEIRFVETVAAQYGLPTALVGSGPLDRDDIGEILAGHAASPLARGIRNYPAAAASPSQARRGAPGSMDDPKWRRGYALLEQYGFSCDLQVPWWHLDAMAELAADFPRTQIVIVHAGMPNDRGLDGLKGWRRALERVTAQPNVAIKISGLGQPGLSWTLEANGPVIRDAVTIFGAERAMFASNYPVDRIVGTFATIYDGFRAAVADRSEAERRKLFHDTAERIYRL